MFEMTVFLFILLKYYATVCSCQLVCEALASLGGSRGDVLTPHLPPVLKLVQKLTLEAPLSAHKTKLMVSLLLIHVMQ